MKSVSNVNQKKNQMCFFLNSFWKIELHSLIGYFWNRFVWSSSFGWWCKFANILHNIGKQWTIGRTNLCQSGQCKGSSNWCRFNATATQWQHGCHGRRKRRTKWRNSKVIYTTITIIFKKHYNCNITSIIRTFNAFRRIFRVFNTHDCKRSQLKKKIWIFV